MNWITTNIRLPEDLYMEFKMHAARERKSVAQVIRERLSKEHNRKANDILKRMDELGRKMAKQNKKLNLTKALIDMRYEQ